MNLLDLKALYDNGVNIVEYLEQQGVARNEAIALSYDLQAGSYTKYAASNQEYTDKYTTELASILNNLSKDAQSLMEVGVGEATTLANVRSRMTVDVESIGFDISLSRILFARQYFATHGKGSARFFVGDLFEIPFADNSIEPNGGREKQALQELYRVAGKYLVLFEPSYELATAEGKERMDRLGYVKDLASIAAELGMKVIKYKLTDTCVNPLNPTALLLIEKDKHATSKSSAVYCCPQTKARLKLSNGSYWSDSALKIYPIILDVPCLTNEHGIVATHYSEFI